MRKITGALKEKTDVLRAISIACLPDTANRLRDGLLIAERMGGGEDVDQRALAQRLLELRFVKLRAHAGN